MRCPTALTTSDRLLWSTGRGTDVWAMFEACASGDMATLTRLVNTAPDLIRSQYAYRRPIYFAVRENRIAAVRFLLQHGADPLVESYDDSLLEMCHDRGYQEMADLLESTIADRYRAGSDGELAAEAIRQHDVNRLHSLLDASPDLLHTGDRRTNQPIHWAVMTRQLDMIDDLLRRGADINAPRADGARPIQLTNGDYDFRGWRDVPSDWPTSPAEVLSFLRQRGAYCDLCTACHVGDFQRVTELLAEDPTCANRVSEYVTYYTGSGAPLTNAARSGHIDIVRLLLAHGADPNLPEEGIAPHGHALYSAVANRHFETATLLLEHGAYPNPEVESSADALSRAIMNDDQAMIELLCSHGAARGVPILAYYGDLRTAAAMFSAKSQLADDPEALANAAGEGHESFVRLLLRYRPELPKRVEFPGWSVGAKTFELNELLFAHGMNPSQADWMGITPLHHLARKGNVERAAQFIAHGADLHACDDHLQSTPLGWAAKFGQAEIAQLLLSRGADPHRPSDLPWARPIEWARRRGHPAVAEILNDFSASSH